jgi:hypothetical protein
VRVVARHSLEQLAQKRRQGLPLVCVQPGQYRGDCRLARLQHFAAKRLAVRGQVQRHPTLVVSGSPAFHEPVGNQAVDKAHGSGVGQPQQLAEAVIGQAGLVANGDDRRRRLSRMPGAALDGSAQFVVQAEDGGAEQIGCAKRSVSHRKKYVTHTLEKQDVNFTCMTHINIE